jgi:hypothetical protein
MGSPIFPGIEHIIECGKSRRVHAVVGTPTCVESNRPLTTSNQFHAISALRPRQTDRENALQRSGVASRTLSRRCIHQDHGARKHAPKRAIRGVGRS